jgi:hypothetical protein
MEKTSYYWFQLKGIGTPQSPDNWISGRPIKVLGICIGWLWKLARPNYPWSK